MLAPLTLHFSEGFSKLSSITHFSQPSPEVPISFLRCGIAKMAMLEVSKANLSVCSVAIHASQAPVRGWHPAKDQQQVMAKGKVKALMCPALVQMEDGVKEWAYPKPCQHVELV